MMPKVAIVYLSYNGKHYLDEVFFALRALDYPKDRLELIFVDNASQDGSREYLADVTGITFIASEKNLGFAGGNNLGITHAVANGADYLYLHNNDLKLDSEAIAQAVLLAESDAKIGSVQSLMLLWKQPEVINSTGGMVHFLGFGFVRENGAERQEAIGKRRDGEEIAYASGAAVLYRASVLKEVGLLDPFFWMYHEDLELGWRIRLAGYKNVLSLHSIAYHDYEFKRSIQKFYWMERNRFLVHFSHLKWRTLFFIAPLMFLAEPFTFLFAIRGGWGKEKLHVYRSLLSSNCWQYVRRKRRESRILRRLPDKEIIRLFTGKIEHQETRSVIVDQVANPLFSTAWKFLSRLIKW